MPPKSQYKFSDGEKVLCFHGPLLYEAKINKCEVKDKLVRYFVHYQGWNKNWDEWVPETRILKYNDENVKMQRDLKDSQDIQKKKKKKSIDTESVPSPASSTDYHRPVRAGRGAKEDKEVKRKIKEEKDVESEVEFTKRVEVKITIPDTIKNWLVDDWDLVTRQKKLVNLPAKHHPTINSILARYVEVKGNNVKDKHSSVELTNGIKEYFDMMLGCQLLYKFERPQYENLVKEYQESENSDIYGLSHLCRLFVKLGHVLAYTNLSEGEMKKLINHIEDFLHFLEKNYSFNANDYSTASPDYVRKTM